MNATKSSCIKCKTFFGSEEMKGYCSVCYKTAINTKELIIPELSTPVEVKQIPENLEIIKEEKIVIEETKPKQVNFYFNLID